MRIGFTGHRPNRLHIGAHHVAVRLGEVCARLKVEATSGSVGFEHIAISPFAEGSDRIFAEAAIAAGFKLHALLPMPVAEYVQTFEDNATTPAFHDLLARSAVVDILPGSRANSKESYDALGRAMVAACDVLVCVWDGKPAAGRGGTPEVIAYALDQGRNVIWVDAANDRPACLLRSIEPKVNAVAWS